MPVAFETAEEPRQQGMPDRLRGGVGSQAVLGGVSATLAVVDEYMIPGLMAVGLGVVRLIPARVGLTVGMCLNHDTPVAVANMLDKFPRGELRCGIAGIVIIERLRETNHNVRA
jgi:hypothetical protein